MRSGNPLYATDKEKLIKIDAAFDSETRSLSG